MAFNWVVKSDVIETQLDEEHKLEISQSESGGVCFRVYGEGKNKPDILFVQTFDLKYLTGSKKYKGKQKK